MGLISLVRSVASSSIKRVPLFPVPFIIENILTVSPHSILDDLQASNGRASFWADDNVGEAVMYSVVLLIGTSVRD